MEWDIHFERITCSNLINFNPENECLTNIIPLSNLTDLNKVELKVSSH